METKNRAAPHTDNNYLKSDDNTVEEGDMDTE